MSFRKTLSALVLTASVFGAAAASAQEAPAAAPITQAITTNPINVILGHYYAEYERAISPAATAAVSASTFDFFGEGRITSVKGKYRYYLNGIAFQGFALTGTGGALYASGDTDGANTEREIFPAVGLEIGYTWRLGARDNILITPNIGAMRVFGTVEGSDFDFAWPTSGLSVGFAF
jgi:hypothetical protein